MAIFKNKKAKQEMELRPFALEEVENYVEQYMNGTYGEACGDTFTVIHLKQPRKANGMCFVYVRSQLLPNIVIETRCDLETHDVYTNYMEFYFYKPILKFLKELCEQAFDECELIYDFCRYYQVNGVDYTCDQKTFMKEHGSSFYLLLKEDCKFFNDKVLGDLLEAICEECKKIGLKIRGINVRAVSEFPEEKIIFFEDFDKKYAKSKKAYRNYSYKDEQLKLLNGGEF